MKMKNYNDFSSLTKKPKKSKSRRRRVRWVLLTSIFTLVFLAAAVGFMIPVASKFALLEIFLTLAPASNLLAETNILVMGVDTNRGTHRSDTIMVAHIDPNEREVRLVSIPRDTLVVIPGRGLDKVNHAFAYGGAELTRSTVSNFLGIDIPYYAKIDVGGLASAIDKLGGITVNVEKRMYYVDYAGGLFVNLKPGIQRLNGREAVGYVRFRHDGDGDHGRIMRQQKFLRALSDELTKRSNILKSPALILSLLSEIKTNLSFRQILGLAMAVRSAHGLGRISMASLPGKDVTIDEVYYWRPDYEGTKKIVNSLLKSSKSADSGRMAGGVI